MAALNIVLVHGTWGRGFFRSKHLAPWCLPDSKFVRGLEHEIGLRMPNVSARVTSYNWSGRNSILQRAAAAAGLRKYLEEKLSPEIPVLIVAHSHGGNVAMRAVTVPTVISETYVCTLATPFFRLFESDRDFEGVENVLFVASVILTGLLVFKFLPSLGADWFLYFLIGGFVLSWINTWILLRVLVNPFPEAGTPTAWQLKPRLLCEATAYDSRALGDRLLVLRGVDDEAALSLAAGAIANRILKFLYEFFVSGYTIIAVRIGVPLLASIVAYLAIQMPEWSEALIFLSGGLLFLAAASCLFLPSLIRPVFGTELAFGVASCLASYDSAPDSDSARITTLPADTDNNGLVHALYENLAAPKFVAEWISTHLKQR